MLIKNLWKKFGVPLLNYIIRNQNLILMTWFAVQIIIYSKAGLPSS